MVSAAAATWAAQLSNLAAALGLLAPPPVAGTVPPGAGSHLLLDAPAQGAPEASGPRASAVERLGAGIWAIELAATPAAVAPQWPQGGAAAELPSALRQQQAAALALAMQDRRREPRPHAMDVAAMLRGSPFAFTPKGASGAQHTRTDFEAERRYLAARARMERHWQRFLVTRTYPQWLPQEPAGAAVAPEAHSVPVVWRRVAGAPLAPDVLRTAPALNPVAMRALHLDANSAAPCGACTAGVCEVGNSTAFMALMQLPLPYAPRQRAAAEAAGGRPRFYELEPGELPHGTAAVVKLLDTHRARIVPPGSSRAYSPNFLVARTRFSTPAQIAEAAGSADPRAYFMRWGAEAMADAKRRGGRTRLMSIWEAMRSAAGAAVDMAPCTADMEWWLAALTDRERGHERLIVSALAAPANSVVNLRSDAAGDVACGLVAGWRVATWARWDEVTSQPERSIQAKELYPLVAFLKRYGRWFGGLFLHYGSDNAANVYAINKGSIADADAAPLLRRLLDACDRHGAEVVASWLPRERNTLCDAMSKSTTPEGALAALKALDPGWTRVAEA